MSAKRRQPQLNSCVFVVVVFLFLFFLNALTPVAMAFRKESKNEEGSGCNGSSMDTVLQAAARVMKNQVFLVHLCAKTSSQTSAAHFNIRLLQRTCMENEGRLSTSILAVGGGGVQLFKALVLVMNNFVIPHSDEIHL